MKTTLHNSLSSKHIVALISLALLTAASHAQSTTETQHLHREDGAETPASIYPVANCKGIAIISHGAGGSETGYAYLAKALQEQAWYTIVPGHRESGMPALRQHMKGKGIIGGLKNGLSSLVTDDGAYRGRFFDIQAALQYAQQHCASDTTVLLGHSMGAATTMLMAGAKNNLRLLAPKLHFDAYVAMSPQGVGSIFPQHAWAGISAPVLSMTGTKDTELGGLSWQTRLDPFNDMQAPCKWGAVVEGATHMSFGGMTSSAKEKSLILDTTLHFMEQIKLRRCDAPTTRAGIELKIK